MQRYDARVVSGWDDNQIWSIPNLDVQVEFDDGIEIVHGKELIVSTYFWTFYTLYPKMQTRKSHLFRGQYFESSSHMKAINRVMWDCYNDYLALGERLDIEPMTKHVYEMVNRFYNAFCTRTGAFVKSSNMTHYLDVMENERIREINANIRPTMKSVEKAKSEIRKVLNDPKELVGNPIAENARTGLVRTDPILDCVGPRGALTDLNSRVFPKPVTVGFVHGIDRIEDSLIESRSATKALSFAEEPLQDTEYFNRTLQLLASSVMNLHPGDCGSTYYTEFIVGNGDLKCIAGMQYMTDKGLKEVQITDKHLIGERLKLRTPFNCIHPDTQGVCETCYGGLSLSIPKGTNIGQASATALCEKITQNVMSTKHTDHVSDIDTLEISEEDQRYIRLGSDPNTICLADRLADKRVILTVPNKAATRLYDINFTDDITSLDLTTISELPACNLTVISKSREDTVVIPLTVGSRMASLSAPLLSYIKETGLMTTNAQGHYDIDLSRWEIEDPLFVLPVQHMNTMEYMTIVKTFLRANEKESEEKASAYKGPTLGSIGDPNEALIQFHQLVNSRMTVNIVHLAVLLQSLLVRNDEPGAAMTRPYHDRSFITTHKAIHYRSMSAAMAFQGHHKLLYTPKTFLVTNRPNHPLDRVLIRK